MEWFHATFEEARMSRPAASGENIVAVEVMHRVPRRKGGLLWTKKSSRCLTQPCGLVQISHETETIFQKYPPENF
jgi:hypothetical protein